MGNAGYESNEVGHIFMYIKSINRHKFLHARSEYQHPIRNEFFTKCSYLASLMITIKIQLTCISFSFLQIKEYGSQ